MGPLIRLPAASKKLSSFLRVFLPALPSTVRPWLRWNAFTAVLVALSKTPFSLTVKPRAFSARCRMLTLLPELPLCSVVYTPPNSPSSAGTTGVIVPVEPLEPLESPSMSTPVRASSLAMVLGPATPSTERPWAFWNARTADFVPLP